jgi:hypothetical protein
MTVDLAIGIFGGLGLGLLLWIPICWVAHVLN